ncbi:unnamed protein product [Cylicocyclus nassatus]|uniref:Uncharacterized protein n=1 Tax=Cylicocyclus nassatus TaxID=53992 RepID=A0AA36DUE1_CYLNA|nr:unnamed protein product [Cylicocyclus nassatus]
MMACIHWRKYEREIVGARIQETSVARIWGRISLENMMAYSLESRTGGVGSAVDRCRRKNSRLGRNS